MLFKLSQNKISIADKPDKVNQITVIACFWSCLVCGRMTGKRCSYGYTSNISVWTSLSNTHDISLLGNCLSWRFDSVIVPYNKNILLFEVNFVVFSSFIKKRIACLPAALWWILFFVIASCSWYKSGHDVDLSLRLLLSEFSLTDKHNVFMAKVFKWNV